MLGEATPESFARALVGLALAVLGDATPESFMPFRLFELPTEADTGTCSEELPEEGAVKLK